MERKIKIPTKEEKRLLATELDVANVIFESMSDKMKIAQLETDLGNAVVEIMTLKMGGSY